MKQGKLTAYIGGLVSFLLIVVSFIIVGSVYVIHGFSKGEEHLLRQLKEGAGQQAVQLASQLSHADPQTMLDTNVTDVSQGISSRQRLLEMGKVVIKLEARNMVEAFFLAKDGQMVSSTLLETMDKSLAQSEIDEFFAKYNTSYFHRALKLQQNQASVQFVPLSFSFDYDRLYQDSLLKEYSLQRRGNDVPLSPMAYFFASLAGANISFPLINASAPVFGHDDVVLGTAHVLISMLPVYAYIEDYARESIQDWLSAFLAAIILSLLVTIILFLSLGKKDDTGAIYLPEGYLAKLAEIDSLGEKKQLAAPEGFYRSQRSQEFSHRYLDAEPSLKKKVMAQAEQKIAKHPELQVSPSKQVTTKEINQEINQETKHEIKHEIKQRSKTANSKEQEIEKNIDGKQMPSTSSYRGDQLNRQKQNLDQGGFAREEARMKRRHGIQINEKDKQDELNAIENDSSAYPRAASSSFLSGGLIIKREKLLKADFNDVTDDGYREINPRIQMGQVESKNYPQEQRDASSPGLDIDSIPNAIPLK